MADLRIDRASDQPRDVPSVSADGRQRGEHDGASDRQPSRQRDARPGAEELAIALSTDGHATVSAQLEHGDDGADESYDQKAWRPLGPHHPPDAGHRGDPCAYGLLHHPPRSWQRPGQRPALLAFC